MNKMKKQKKKYLVRSMSLKLKNTDSLIISAWNNLTNDPLTSRRFPGIVETKSGELDIKVGIRNISRALIFMDNLVKELKAKGHRIVVEYGSTYAIVEGQKIKISLREKTKQKLSNDSWRKFDYHPTGVLAFRIDKCYGPEREWRDGKLSIRKHLADIVSELEKKGRTMKEGNERWLMEREAQKEKERIEQEFEQQQEEELTRFKKLLCDAYRWNQTKILREYLEQVRANSVKNNLQSLELENWLYWANKKADWYDPNAEGEDELLKNVDKYSLMGKRSANSYSLLTERNWMFNDTW
jgi:hypothetical protein